MSPSRTDKSDGAQLRAEGNLQHRADCCAPEDVGQRRAGVVEACARTPHTLVTSVHSVEIHLGLGSGKGLDIIGHQTPSVGSGIVLGKCWGRSG